METEKKNLCPECGQVVKKEKSNEIELARASRQAVDVLSKILGISEKEAEMKLEEKDKIPHLHTPVAATGSGMAEAFIKISQILDLEIQSGAVNRRSRPWEMEFSDNYLTVAAWIKANSMRIALLKTRNAFIYVGFGVIMNRIPTRASLGAVHQIIFLDQMHKATERLLAGSITLREKE